MTDAAHRLGEMRHRFTGCVQGMCHFAKRPSLLALRTTTDSPAVGRRRLMSAGSSENAGYVKLVCGSGRRQEIDRVDDRDRDDVFLGAEVESPHAVHDLVGQDRRLHGR